MSMSSSRACITALTVGSSAIVFVDAGVPVLAPALHSSFGLSVAGLGWVSSAYALTVALLAFPVSFLAARTGPRRALQAGLVLFAIGTGTFAFAPSSELLILGRVVQGAGTAFVSPTMLAVLRSHPAAGR